MVHFDAFRSLATIFASAKVLARNFIVIKVSRDFSSARSHCGIINVRTGSPWSSRRLTRELVCLRELRRFIKLWNSRSVVSSVGHQTLYFDIWNFAFQSRDICNFFGEVLMFLDLRSLLQMLSVSPGYFLGCLLMLDLLQLLDSNVFFSLVFRIFRCLSRVRDLLSFAIFGLYFLIVLPIEAALGDCSTYDIFCFDLEPLWEVHV